MAKLFLKPEFGEILNKTLPFMGYTEININRFWLKCIPWQPSKRLSLLLNLVFM